METNNTGNTADFSGNPEKSCETCGNNNNFNYVFCCESCVENGHYISKDLNNCKLCKHNGCNKTDICGKCIFSEHNNWEPKENKTSEDYISLEKLSKEEKEEVINGLINKYKPKMFLMSTPIGDENNWFYKQYLTSEEEIIEDKCSSCGNKDNKNFKLCRLSCGKNNNYSGYIPVGFHSCQTCDNNSNRSMCMGCSFKDHDHWGKIKTKVEIDNKLPEKINDNFKVIFLSTPSGENRIYKQYLTYLNERRIMSDLVTEIKTLEKVTYIIPAAGHNKGTIIPKSERNEDGTVNKIHLTKKEPKLSEEILEKIQFAGEYTISVDKTFNVKDATVTITDGLIVIEVPVQKDYVTEITVK